MGSSLGIGKCLLMGESVMLTYFTNAGSQKRTVVFSAPFPGSIIPLNLAELGEEVICQKESFLAAALGTQVNTAFQKHLGSGFFGGEGMVLAALFGTGSVWIQSMPFSRLAERVLSHSIFSSQGEQ